MVRKGWETSGAVAVPAATVRVICRLLGVDCWQPRLRRIARRKVELLAFRLHQAEAEELLMRRGK